MPKAERLVAELERIEEVQSGAVMVGQGVGGGGMGAVDLEGGKDEDNLENVPKIVVSERDTPIHVHRLAYSCTTENASGDRAF